MTPSVLTTAGPAAAKGGAVRTWRWRPAAFWCGLVAALVAVSPPVHVLADVSFAAHMAQHLSFILMAAPLIALGQPVGSALAALPGDWRHRAGTAYGSAFSRAGVRAVFRLLTRPLVAWTLHAVALWAWHAPPLFQAALASDVVHAAEHASFLATGVLYWWSLLAEVNHRRHGALVAVASLFATGMQSSILGALLTFSTVAWYPTYATQDSAARWGLTSAADQQLAGLIMWIPAGLVYTAASLAFLGIWLRREDVRGA